MFDATTLKAISRFASSLGIEPAALEAVAEIESGGQVYAVVEGRKQPLIRWEGHYFYRLLAGDARKRAVAAGLASSKAGAVKNPKGQPARWSLLNRAILIDSVAALESCSWGLGQVMGEHWRWLGFASVTEMVNLCRRDAAGQIEVMARFIDKAGLADELRRRDFTAFARGYNGPQYAKNAYHTKMAAAYERITQTAPVSAATGMLRMGSKGARVRELQALLVRAGHSVRVDGDYGPTTRDAVKAYQLGEKITADGVAGPETMRRLDRFRQGAADRPGAQQALEVPEVSASLKSLGPLALFAMVQGKLTETASYLFGIEADAAQAVANGLMAGASLIGLGLLIWAVVGWVRSRRTDEGDVTA